ncbi:MAG: MBL fold metallo-hydrolase [Nanoarchaeota archaeon]
MDATITFLGTAGDSTVMGKQLAASGGIVLTDGTFQIHLNPGPGSLVQAKRHGINVRNTDVLLASENLPLQTGDLNASVEAMTLGGLDRKGVLLAPPGVVEGSERYTPTLSIQQAEHLERVIKLRIGDKVGIGDITIHPTQTSLEEDLAIGYILRTPHYCVGYCGRTRYSKKIAGQFSHCDIVILHFTFDDHSTLEQDSESCINLLKDAQPRLAIMTGFGVKALREDVLSIIRSMHKETGIQCMSAKDGLSVNPASYAKKVRQKSLDM